MPPEPEAIAKSELRLRHLARRKERPEAERATAADAVVTPSGGWQAVPVGR